MTPNRLLVLGIAGPELTGEEEDLYRRVQPGGFVLFTRNVVSAAQTRALTDRLRSLCERPPLIAIDNEGGRVWRTAPFTPSPPSAAEMASTGNRKLISQFGWITGQLLGQLGINLNLAPVLDIDHHPEAANALRGRCWGSVDQDVIDHAGTFNRWQRRQRILGCAKHFPAGGRARSDPHHELPVVDAPLEEIHRRDVTPYTALQPELDAVMISHLHFPQIDADGLPASLSKNIIQRFLRNQLGFDRHLILTDDLDMGAIQNHYGTPAATRMTIEAGADLALLCHEFLNAEESLAALQTLPPAPLIEANERIQRALERVPASPPFSTGKIEELGEAIEKLRTDVLGTAPGNTDASGPGQSPVEEY